MVVAFFTTIGQVTISALAGYGFARLKFKGSEPLFYIFLLTMMVPPQVNIVPLFYLMSKLGWINTYQALIIPGIFGGFGVFMMRQYFLNFSKELEEAAKLDGCNPGRLSSKSPYLVPCRQLQLYPFLHLSQHGIVFMWPLIVTNTDNMRTLAVGLTIFKGSFREITM